MKENLFYELNITEDGYVIGRHNHDVADSVSIIGYTEESKHARLFVAAPELLEVLTYGQTLNLPDMLDWVADRLVNVHGENCNLDFILSIRERASKARAAINKATGETK